MWTCEACLTTKSFKKKWGKWQKSARHAAREPQGEPRFIRLPQCNISPSMFKKSRDIITNWLSELSAKLCWKGSKRFAFHPFGAFSSLFAALIWLIKFFFKKNRFLNHDWKKKHKTQNFLFFLEGFQSFPSNIPFSSSPMWTWWTDP